MVPGSEPGLFDSRFISSPKSVFPDQRIIFAVSRFTCPESGLTSILLLTTATVNSAAIACEFGQAGRKPEAVGVGGVWSPTHPDVTAVARTAAASQSILVVFMYFPCRVVGWSFPRARRFGRTSYQRDEAALIPYTSKFGRRRQ
jgi:hypothetical protein